MDGFTPRDVFANRNDLESARQIHVSDFRGLSEPVYAMMQNLHQNSKGVLDGFCMAYLAMRGVDPSQVVLVEVQGPDAGRSIYRQTWRCEMSDAFEEQRQAVKVRTQLLQGHCERLEVRLRIANAKIEHLEARLNEESGHERR